MATVTFDTLKFVKKLKESGIPESQAEAISDAIKEASGEVDVATKGDLRELEYRLVIKLGAMMMAAIAVVATLVKLL